MQVGRGIPVIWDICSMSTRPRFWSESTRPSAGAPAWTPEARGSTAKAFSHVRGEVHACDLPHVLETLILGLLAHAPLRFFLEPAPLFGFAALCLVLLVRQHPDEPIDVGRRKLAAPTDVPNQQLQLVRQRHLLRVDRSRAVRFPFRH